MNQDLAIDIIVNKRKNVFLTGESGAGKTWVINECRKRFEDKGLVCAVTATTGIAATHINGKTIHSLTGIGVKTEYDLFEQNEWYEVANKSYIRRGLLELDALVIDEISMLHSYQLLAIDFILKYIKGIDTPFGGLQVIVCGDFFQLPPVTKGSERAKFVYECPIWEDSGFLTCYLTEQFRQGDQKFLSCLRDIRKGEISHDSKAIIADLLNTSKTVDESEKTLKLYPKNVDVDKINNQELDKLTGEPYKYSMTKSGQDIDVDRLIKNCLAPQELTVKLGAKVMFVKNNYNKGYVNGSIGVIIDFKKIYDELGNHIYSYPVVQLRDHRLIVAEPEEWCLEEYVISHYDKTKKKNVLTKRKLASIIQIPLRLAWAITIHKSQGMSLDEADMNLNEVFEQGMGYVALSRVRSLDGLILRGINRIALEVNSDVLNRDRIFREESLVNEEIYLPKMNNGAEELSRESIFREAMKRQKDSRLSKYSISL